MSFQVLGMSRKKDSRTFLRDRGKDPRGFFQVTNFQRPFARRNVRDLRRHRLVHLGRGLLGRCRQPRSANARESTRPEAAGEYASAHGSVHDPPPVEWSAAASVPTQYYLEDDVFVMSRRTISIITSRRGRVYLGLVKRHTNKISSSGRTSRALRGESMSSIQDVLDGLVRSRRYNFADFSIEFS